MNAANPSNRSRPKVLVAMSGGVDSSVAACLLVEQGYDVMGLFMRVGAEVPEPVTCSTDGKASTARSHQGCCSASDAADARFVAGKLGIPFYALNFKADFERIIDYFADEYVSGRTPNPCVQCNTWLKFGKLIDYADAIGAKFVATGHYARLDRIGPGVRLRRGVDERKDQSYFLFGVDSDRLARAMFPIGDLEKDEVRAAARRFGLPISEKPDSVEICFAPDRDYARVVRDRRPEAFRPGPVLDPAGKVLGDHGGVAGFTIGQRRGLGIAADRPKYVTALNVLDNTVVLGDREDLLASSLIAREPNLLVEMPADGIRCQAKIRYQHKAADCRARLVEAGELRVDFDQPQTAITPGQAVVLYDGDVVLGGGWIERSVRPA